MYYEDENNLYHYSYRKGDKVENVRDVDYTEVPNTAAKADPWEEKKPKKNRLGLKIAALALACALIGGAAGAGITHHAFASARGSTQIEVSDRQVAEVRQVKVDGKQQLTMPEVYAANVNSVVSINVSTTTNVFGRTTESAASGSGFFITKDGYILTNYHVIEGASTVKVTAYDGTTYDAAVIGGDEDYDIAVIKVEGTNFQPVVIGKSGSVQIGETVAAVGNPLGELTFSMSQGIVSCVNRAINVDGKPFNMIQVDCSINPGNSGGPLFNSYGEVIGIVSAKYSSYSNTTVEGIGFAIPSSMAERIVNQLKQDKKVSRGWIGVTIQDVDENTAKALGLPEATGALIGSVMPDEPAAKGGMKDGDVVLEVNGQKIDDSSALLRAIATETPGSKVNMVVWRDGERKNITVQLGERNLKASSGKSGSAVEQDAPSIGLSVRPLTKEEARTANVKPGTGLLIVGVEPGKLAAEAELREGDIILSANLKPIKSVEEFSKIIREDAKKRGVVMLQLQRQGQTFFRSLALSDTPDGAKK